MAGFLVVAQPPTPARSPALEALIHRADETLQAGSFSVMNKKLTPPSGDKHDYMSVGPYWWPDPSKPSGLPYIRKDGERNPERESNDTDSRALHTVLGAVPTLALAYRETGREEYARHAARLLRAWFLDPATKMNPNLDFAQAIPGLVAGRGTGIIDTAGIVEVAESLGWLARSSAWTKADQAGMKSWMEQYLDWLATSKNGREEAAAKNNHGTWYDAQVAAMALFTGQRDLARRVTEEAKTKRIAAEIEPDGRQPRELARTNAFSYSVMNLRAFFNLAAMGEQVNVDLWHYQTEDGRGIRKALDFLAPYADPAKPWPHAQLSGVKIANRMELAVLLRRAALAYPDACYESLLSRLPAEEMQANRMQILWPASNASGKSCAAAATPGKRLVGYGDLSPELQALLAGQGTTAEQFTALIRSIQEETETRLREGERDHLIYFLLQSMRFTRRPKIEPALSAREFVQSLEPEERARYLAGDAIAAPVIPRKVRERIVDFLRALDQDRSDERLNWFRTSIAGPERTIDQLSEEYARAMRFLYQKEFGGGERDSSLYQRRGHSSDTRIESSFPVWTALSVLKTLDASARMNRVLIVGPGQDFAPRTGLVDAYPPQSYQPFAVADALLALGLAGRDRLRIDCVDINDRVLDFFREFPKRRERRLTLLLEWNDPEYVEYFRGLGRSVGTETAIPGGKSLLVSKELTERVAADKLNIIAERYDPPRQYDLIVATNVLVYFNNTELLLALSNIHSMLAGGGILIHNELRPEVEQFSAALRFPVLQARTLRLSQGTARPLFDSFVIHRKARGPTDRFR